MKEQKVGLTPMNWILSILGILLLMCIIILPPVFRAFIKEEVKEEPTATEFPILTTTCYKDNIMEEYYTDNETLVFYHQNQNIKKVNRKIERTYLDTLIYQEEKSTYGKLVTAFSVLTGLDYTATPNDDNSVVEISETYDLKTFQPTVIVIPGDTEPTEISIDYQFNDSITSTTQKLIANGYVCEQ